MDDIPVESPVSAQRSRKRVLWIRGALTVALVFGALTVLLGREDPALFGAARERIFPVVSRSHAIMAAPTPRATPDPVPLSQLLPLLRQRPLHISALAAGETCVAAPGKQVAPELGPALGDGSVYMVGYGTEGTNTIYMSREDGGWYYLKTIWTAPPDFHSVFLLHGRQVDGPNEVRFSSGDITATPENPDSSAVFSSNEVGSTQSGWLPWDDYVRVRAPGCYGIQVDGLDFSYIIRFKVIDTPYIPEG